MRRAILVTVALLTLVVVSTALAAQSYYWAERGTTYRCQGIASGVTCRETNWRPAYSVRIFPGYVTVTHGNNLIFGCERGFTPANNCEYYGP